MAIMQIEKSEFDKFKPARNPMLAAISVEECWYRDSAGNVIGVVIFDKTDRDWTWVALGRDERGNFRAIEVTSSIADKADAQTSLVTKLSEIERTGQSVFPQGD
jgi:hypothetical protein